MKTEKIELVKYTRGEEVLNCITHLLGLLLPAFIFIRFIPLCENKPFEMLCAVLYGVGTAMTFTASVIYHALPEGNAKRVMRVIDHSAIFFAVAGTVTGCVPAVFRKGSVVGAVLMLVVSWGSVILGLVLTICYFGRFGKFRMCLYIFSSAFSALLGSETYFHLPISAFLCLIIGGVTLLTGCIFLRIGAKKQYIHCVFHIFIVAGLSVFCYGIYNFVYLI